MSEAQCRTCFGTGRVKVSWSPVVGSTYRIKVHYDPCPDCRPSEFEDCTGYPVEDTPDDMGALRSVDDTRRT